MHKILVIDDNPEHLAGISAIARRAIEATGSDVEVTQLQSAKSLAGKIAGIRAEIGADCKIVAASTDNDMYGRDVGVENAKALVETGIPAVIVTDTEDGIAEIRRRAAEVGMTVIEKTSVLSDTSPANALQQFFEEKIREALS